MTIRISIDRSQIAEFCRKWSVTELALFGSVLREDFGPTSDVDVLVTFDAESHRTLFDLAHMQEELSQLFGREVDLLTRRSVEASRNPIRRAAILSSLEVVHAA